MLVGGWPELVCGSANGFIIDAAMVAELLLKDRDFLYLAASVDALLPLITPSQSLLEIQELKSDLSFQHVQRYERGCAGVH